MGVERVGAWEGLRRVGVAGVYAIMKRGRVKGAGAKHTRFILSCHNSHNKVNSGKHYTTDYTRLLTTLKVLSTVLLLEMMHYGVIH
mgnify:FL=1